MLRMINLYYSFQNKINIWDLFHIYFLILKEQRFLNECIKLLSTLFRKHGKLRVQKNYIRRKITTDNG